MGVTALASSLAVLEVVFARSAAAVAVLALEDALVHVGVAAARGLDLHAVTAHVGLAGDVDSGVRTSGELAPGVENLTVLENGDAVVQSGKGTSDVLGHGDGDTVTGVGQRPGDVRLANVDEAGNVVGLQPDDNNDGSRATLVGTVGEGEGGRAIVANPDLAVVAAFVLTHGAKANVGHVLAILAGQTPDRVVAVEAALGQGGDGILAITVRDKVQNQLDCSNGVTFQREQRGRRQQRQGKPQQQRW